MTQCFTEMQYEGPQHSKVLTFLSLFGESIELNEINNTCRAHVLAQGEHGMNSSYYHF